MNGTEKLQDWMRQYKNIVLLGEAGSGKSEIACNLAVFGARNSEREVHFFDLDMTKPLFRSRDVSEVLSTQNVHFHFQDQFMDAPTQVGGVRSYLKNPDTFVILDVGGDYIGAREIGGYSSLLNREDTLILYVVNPFRPWSYDIDHIDETLRKILFASRVTLTNLHFVSNPNRGYETTLEDFREGNRKASDTLAPYCSLELSFIREELVKETKQESDIPVFPLHLYLTYPWLLEE